MGQVKLYRTVQVLLFLFLLFAGLYFTKGFLLPVAFGILFSTLLLPWTERLENIGIPRVLAITVCLIGIIAVIGGLLYLMWWQLSGITEEISTAKHAFKDIIAAAERMVRSTLGLSVQEQEKLLEEQKVTTGQNASNIVKGFLGTFFQVLTHIVLIIVYIFLFIMFRERIKMFVIKLMPAEQHEKTMNIIDESKRVAHYYLSGMAKMIAWIFVLYVIGLSIVGVNHAVMFALISSTLEIVPFLGNFIGATLTIIMALIQGGGLSMVGGVVLVYITVQTIQGYILEPIIVGSEVNINPLFIIVALVLGQAVWGLAGMFIAIPTLGVVKILCDNIEPLKPYGYLLGTEKKPKKKIGFIQSIIRRFKKDNDE